MEGERHTREFLKSSDVEGREFAHTNEGAFFKPLPERAVLAKKDSVIEEDVSKSKIEHAEEIDFSDEDFHPENHPNFPRWRKIVLEVGIGVTTFGVLAILTPIPFGLLITPLGVGIMTIAVGKKHAQRHLKSIFTKMTDWVATEGKKIFARKNKQEPAKDKK